MDSYRISGQEQPEIFHIEVDEAAKASLLETARWGKFLAVIGIVLLSLLLLAGLLAGAMISSVDTPYSNMLNTMGTVGVVVYFLVIIALNFYPIYALMKFSSTIKHALNTADKVKFNIALDHLKGMFKYMGIVTIICISLYGLVVIFTAIGAAMHV